MKGLSLDTGSGTYSCVYLNKFLMDPEPRSPHPENGVCSSGPGQTAWGVRVPQGAPCHQWWVLPLAVAAIPSASLAVSRVVCNAAQLSGKKA